jgi:branched-chain amino acid transport system substrate-binding protein
MRRTHLLRGIAIGMLCAIACAAAVAACGSGNSPGRTSTGASVSVPPTQTVDIYSSLPLDGPRRAESEAIMTGIKVARYQYGDHFGNYYVQYKFLNDATKKTDGWSQAKTVAHALQVARDPRALVYIGDLDSGATEYSLPILNQAGIAQITPGSGYPGLTNNVHGVTSGTEPDRFYPNPRSHTLLRLIPSDLVEAAAALDKLKSRSCVHVATDEFGGGVDASALVRAVRATAKLYGMVAVPNPKGFPTDTLGTNTKLYPTYVEDLRDAQVGCLVLAGRVTPDAIALTKDFRAVLTAGYVVGTSGFCNRGWLGRGANAIPVADEHYLYCTSPVLPLSKYPGGKAFTGLFRKMVGNAHARPPGPYAVFGYQAAEMAINAMQDLEVNADNRKLILEELESGEHGSALVGSFEFDDFGNLVSDRYPLYSFDDGRLVYVTTLTRLLVLL